MKVMHVIHGLSMGGAETLVKEYALKINKENFDVIILCFHRVKDSPYEKMIEKNHIKIIYMEDYQKYYNNRQLLFRCYNHIQRYILIKKIIHKENPDILHTHLKINKYIKFANPKKHTKIFHTVHSDPKRYWPTKRNSDYKAALKLVKNHKMRFICLHNEMKNEINKMFDVQNSLILNNGIDINKFENVINKYEMREKLKIPTNAFVIGHVGRFDKVKNHNLLIEIFNNINNKKKNAFLLMIGSGNERNEIEKKLYNLKLKNYKILENRTDIPDILNTMDIFVFPSIKEGIPLSLIEVQEAKIPCFISDGVPEAATISNIVTRISLKKSAEEWANDILNYTVPKKIEVDDKNWNMNNIVKKLEKIYEEE